MQSQQGVAAGVLNNESTSMLKYRRSHIIIMPGAHATDRSAIYREISVG